MQPWLLMMIYWIFVIQSLIKSLRCEIVKIKIMLINKIDVILIRFYYKKYNINIDTHVCNWNTKQVPKYLLGFIISCSKSL